jgi:hypothetical protein
MRVSCALCAAAHHASKKVARKEDKLRRLVGPPHLPCSFAQSDWRADLYHATTSFPHKSNMLPLIDATLLSKRLYPSPLSLNDLLVEELSFDTERRSPWLSKTDMAERDSVLTAVNPIPRARTPDELKRSAEQMKDLDTGRPYHPLPWDTPGKLGRAKEERWRKVAEALHGVTQGARATLETVEQRKNEV